MNGDADKAAAVVPLGGCGGSSPHAADDGGQGTPTTQQTEAIATEGKGSEPACGVPPCSRTGCPEDRGAEDRVVGEGLPRLPGDDAELTSSELGDALGVSDQTVRNWKKAGMRPCGANARGDDVWRFGEAKAWKTRNRPAAADHGGRRAGSGAKRKAKSEKRKAEPAIPGQTTLADAEAGKKADEEKLALARQQYRGNAATPEQLQLLLSRSEESGGLSLVDAKIRSEHLDADRKNLELRTRLGELVEAGAVEESWASFLREIAGKLAGWPGRAAAELAGVLRLTPEQVLAARNLLSRQAEELKREIVEGMEEGVETPVARAA